MPAQSKPTSSGRHANHANYAEIQAKKLGLRMASPGGEGIPWIARHLLCAGPRHTTGTITAKMSQQILNF
ncbi:MAG TPA: hypothetical protein PKE31_21650 [Pseudomonadota bacterium]|nr:hypothetical protein [Pseudomonadota bacterium]